MKVIKIEYHYSQIKKALVEVNGVKEWVSGRVFKMMKSLERI